MSYRNKTYVIFDGDKDMWAYAYMIGWKKSENIDFNFHDAHELNTINEGSSEATVKRRLRERFSSAKQVIVLLGESTKHLYRFVRWEIETAQILGLPIICVNLSSSRKYEPDACPPILKNTCVVHIAFKAKIIKYALDDWPSRFSEDLRAGKTNRYYSERTYELLDL